MVLWAEKVLLLGGGRRTEELWAATGRDNRPPTTEGLFIIIDPRGLRWLSAL